MICVDLVRLPPCNDGTGEICRSVIPEVGHAIEGRLLVEDVALCIHYNRAIYKVFNPVRSSSLVQRQVPVRPTDHVMI